jgi:hypothetical protein
MGARGGRDRGLLPLARRDRGLPPLARRDRGLPLPARRDRGLPRYRGRSSVSSEWRATRGGARGRPVRERAGGRGRDERSAMKGWARAAWWLARRRPNRAPRRPKRPPRRPKRAPRRPKRPPRRPNPPSFVRRRSWARGPPRSAPRAPGRTRPRFAPTQPGEAKICPHPSARPNPAANPARPNPAATHPARPNPADTHQARPWVVVASTTDPRTAPAPAPPFRAGWSRGGPAVSGPRPPPLAPLGRGR